MLYCVYVSCRWHDGERQRDQATLTVAFQCVKGLGENISIALHFLMCVCLTSFRCPLFPVGVLHSFSRTSVRLIRQTQIFVLGYLS